MLPEEVPLTEALRAEEDFIQRSKIWEDIPDMKTEEMKPPKHGRAGFHHPHQQIAVLGVVLGEGKG